MKGRNGRPFPKELGKLIKKRRRQLSRKERDGGAEPLKAAKLTRRMRNLTREKGEKCAFAPIYFLSDGLFH